MGNGNSKLTFRSSAIGFIFLLCSLPNISVAADWQWMTPQRAYSLIKEGSGLWLVDVRNEVAFTETHIEGAVHIPVDQLTTKQLPKEKIIVLVDDSLGLRKGREAAEALFKKGHERVFLLEGGIPAWQDEKYMMAGKGSGRAFRRVMPDDIDWALKNQVKMRILDLREKGEQAQGPVPQAQPVDGKTMAERLEKVKMMNAAKKREGLGGQLEKTVVTILVFPSAVDPRPLLERSFREVPGDIRYLEGGFAAWAARPDKTNTSTGTCPTCSGGPSGGKK